MSKKVNKPAFRTAYDASHHGVVNRVQKRFEKPSRTKQEFKDDCNINLVWAKFVKTGRAEVLQNARANYVDLIALPESYQESLNLVLRSRQAFEALPSDIRARFDNDPGQFLAAAQSDPQGLYELLGGKPEDDSTVASASPATPVPGPSSDEAPASSNAD